MSARGFTLLEVMISLAILAIGLVAIADLNGGAVQMHAYARRASEASLLLRGKMLDVEELLHKDGFTDYDDEKHGDFDAEQAPDYKWSAEILKPDIKLDPSQLLGMMGGSGDSSGSSSGSSSSSSSSSSGGLGGILSAIGGGGGLASLLGGSSGSSSGISSGSPSGAAGLASAGPFAGIIQGQAKQFVETIKQSVREIRLTVTWKDGNVDRSISASQIIVVLPESVGAAGQTQQMTPQQIAQQAQQQAQSAQQGQPAKPLGTVNVSGDGDSK
jgi:general secretion pathway protein I